MGDAAASIGEILRAVEHGPVDACAIVGRAVSRWPNRAPRLRHQQQLWLAQADHHQPPAAPVARHVLAE
eukprot:680456-Rhodomonas_salina.1